MQNDRGKTTESDKTANDIDDMTSSASTSPPGSSAVALLSTVGTATLISLFVGVCYYYTHHHREAYLGKLGLDPEVLPITMQDAIVDGFEGVVLNVLWVVAILAVGMVANIALAWAGAYALQKLFRKLGFSPKPKPKALHPTLIDLGRNEVLRTFFFAALIAIGATYLGGLGAVLVGGPADASGNKNAKALLERVKSADGRCARYELKGGSALVGWRVGSSPDRQFVLGNDSAVHVIKFDDLQRLIERDVPCQKRTTASTSKARETGRSK